MNMKGHMIHSHKYSPPHVANSPRIGVKAKNCSIISKNNSSYSDKNIEKPKADDKDSCTEHLKFSTAKKSIQLYPKFSEERSIKKKGKMYKHTKANSKNEKCMLSDNLGFASLKVSSITPRYPFCHKKSSQKKTKKTSIVK